MPSPPHPAASRQSPNCHTSVTITSMSTTTSWPAFSQINTCTCRLYLVANLFYCGNIPYIYCLEHIHTSLTYVVTVDNIIICRILSAQQCMNAPITRFFLYNVMGIYRSKSTGLQCLLLYSWHNTVRRSTALAQIPIPPKQDYCLHSVVLASHVPHFRDMRSSYFVYYIIAYLSLS